MQLSAYFLLPLVVAGGYAEESAQGDVAPGQIQRGAAPGFWLNLFSWGVQQKRDLNGAPLLEAGSSPFVQMGHPMVTVKQCPPPFLPVMSQCFYASRRHKLSWDDARSFCRQMGGDLAQPLYLNALMVHLQDRIPEVNEFFLGASDREEEGTWKYLSGRPVDRAGWIPGEPSDSGHSQNCLTFCFQGCAAAYPPLNDQLCERKRSFVCEFSGF